MMNEMTLKLNQGITYSGEAEKVINFFSDKLPSEVRNLLSKCTEVIRPTENIAGKVVINIQEIISKIDFDLNPTEKFSNELDESGSYMGLKINKITLKETLNVMKKNGFSKYDIHNNNVYFPELDLLLHFDVKDVLKEITLKKDNKSQTSKGLKVGDSIYKAFEIYGQPKMSSIISAMWKNVSVTIQDDFITSIRIQ